MDKVTIVEGEGESNAPETVEAVATEAAGDAMEAAARAVAVAADAVEKAADTIDEEEEDTWPVLVSRLDAIDAALAAGREMMTILSASLASMQGTLEALAAAMAEQSTPKASLPVETPAETVTVETPPASADGPRENPEDRAATAVVEKVRKVRRLI